MSKGSALMSMGSEDARTFPGSRFGAQTFNKPPEPADDVQPDDDDDANEETPAMAARVSSRSGTKVMSHRSLRATSKAPSIGRCSSRVSSKVSSIGQCNSGISKRSSVVSSIYDDQVERVLSLSSPTLLRAVPFGKVLQCFGQVWASSQGTMEDYELSAPVDQIDHFLSHAWATPRLKKVIALMVYYNFLPALFIAAFCGTAGGLAKLSGMLQMFSVEDSYFIVGESTWLISLAFFHEIYRLFGSRCQSVVFLDKLCIHQTDPEIKAHGIQGLPAFLENSRSMVILYADAYLTRLWTIYELATYLLMRPNGHVEILPVDLPLLPFAGVALVTFTPRSNFYQFWSLAEVVGFLLVAVLCRWLADMSRKIDEAFKNFDIHKANCFFEGDRITVEGNVEAFMKHKGEVELDASLEEALAAFNNVVHERVPQMMKRSMGVIGIPYRITIMVDIPGIAQVFDLLWRFFWTGDVLTAQAVDFFLTLCHWVLVGPIALAAGVCVAKVFVNREGCAWVVVALAAIFMTLFTVEWVLAMPFFALAFLAQHHRIKALVGLMAYCCLLLLSLFLIYGWPAFLAGRGREEAVEMGADSDFDAEGDDLEWEMGLRGGLASCGAGGGDLECKMDLRDGLLIPDADEGLGGALLRPDGDEGDLECQTGLRDRLVCL